MPIMEFDTGQILLGVFLVLATFGANVFVGAMVARRTGVGYSGDYFIGFITGTIGTAVPFFIIGGFPVIGLDFALTFVITAVLAWAISKWSRMGAKADEDSRDG